MGIRTMKKQNLISARAKQYLLTVIAIGVAVLLCAPLSKPGSYHLVAFILLLVVSALATFLDAGPVLLASTLGAIVWNYFFIPPHFTFHIERAEDILMFIMFYVVALINGVLTTRVRRQERLARLREQNTHALYRLTQELGKAEGAEGVMEAGRSGIRDYFGFEVHFLIPGPGEWSVESWQPALDTIGREASAAARETYESGKPSGRYTPILPHLGVTFYRLPGSRTHPGLAYIFPDAPFSDHQQTLWDTFLRQIGNALEREHLNDLAQKARLLAESENLYRTLFNSVSHEFRIPVATLLGASDALLTENLSAGNRSALYREIAIASRRLDRLVENLLNMSRIESGRIAVHRDWHDIHDIINKVLNDLREDLETFSVSVFVMKAMPLVKVDFGLLEQALYNLLINVSGHAAGSPLVEIRASYADQQLILEVMDRGPGFSGDIMSLLPGKHSRTDRNSTGGLGLGLSIVKGFTEAHHGNVFLNNREGGGASVRLFIPAPQAAYPENTPGMDENG
ncbi:MAG TPA: DUF4118 domain-containing protein [Bacteroidales bacterium]|nr:DUF4118 domain-containing protein [Bacteroidales bacterium]HRZ77744.1 DUF4118 domain-containing protein [Bacteroidales bacterium]